MTAPFTKKPSIIDRVLGRLIPTGQYGDVLSPVETKAIRSQGLMQLGTGILSQSGPGTGPLQAFGRSYQALDVPGMATHALRLQQYHKAVTDQAALEQAAASVQRQPGESDYDYISRKAAATAGLPGADRMSSILDALKQHERPERVPLTQVVDLHQDGTWLVDRGTGAKIARLGPGTVAAGAQGSGALKQKMQAGALTAVQSIDDAEKLLAKNGEADVLPVGAAMARGAKASGGIIGALGGIAEPLAQESMTGDQQQFQADMQRMVHSMVGLLPGSRQSIVLFNSLVNAYTPASNESAQGRTAKRAARQRARKWLDAIRRGESIPIPPELSQHGITAADIGADEAVDGAKPDTPRYEDNPY